MQKFYKVIKIILISLLVAVLAAYVVLYIVNNELAKEIMARLVDYLNRPLPIIGVSTIVVAVFVYKIFNATIYGKRNLTKQKNQFEEEKQELINKYESREAQCVSVIKSYQDEIDLIYNAFLDICDSNPNLKIKIVGEKLKKEITIKKEELRATIKKLVEANPELMANSKEEIINEIVEKVKKEVEANYGEQEKEIFNSIPKEKNV